MRGRQVRPSENRRRAGLLATKCIICISRNLRKSYKGFFEKIDFDIEGKINKIDLPTSRRYDPSKTVRNGMHRQAYDQEMARVLNSIQRDLEAGKISKEQALEKVEKLIGATGEKLEDGLLSLNGSSDREPPSQRKDHNDESNKSYGNSDHDD